MYEEIKFEVGGQYRNRLGWYQVLEIKGDGMRVNYEIDGRGGILSIKTQKNIVANISQEEKRISLIAANRETFFFYVKVCNEHYRFKHDLILYREIIDRHRADNSLDLLLDDENFYFLIMSTLKKWNMDQRGAKLAAIDDLKESILIHRVDLIKLYRYKLHLITEDEVDHKLIGLLQKIFSNLKIMESKRRIVGVSKALHFLLPDLVMPMDGKYTLMYFFNHNKYRNTIQGEFNIFEDIFAETYRIAKKLNLNQSDVDGKSWNTSIPKLIDNSIIGFYKYIENHFGKENPRSHLQ
jgi:hypothetical protein